MAFGVLGLEALTSESSDLTVHDTASRTINISYILSIMANNHINKSHIQLAIKIIP